MHPSNFAALTRATGRSLTLLAGMLTFAGCSGGEDPQVPSGAAAAVSTQITALVASTVSTEPAIVVTDANGRGVRNVMVRWTVAAGGGRVLNDSVRTNNTGRAASGGWTLGTASGTQSLRATADGLPPVIFTATAAAGNATRLVRVGPETQQASVNTNVPVAPSARAEDQFGNPVAGLQVNFSVSSDNGAIEGGSQITNAQGLATATSWRLGTTTGQQIARVTALNVQQAAFSSTAISGPPASLLRVAGDGQQGVSGGTVRIAPGVRVRDAFGNPVGGVTVLFTPGPGSGSVSGGSVISEATSGTAFVGSWTLGAQLSQTLTASVATIPDSALTFTAEALNSAFNLDVRFVGDGGSPLARAAFIQAAERWRSVITGDLHSTLLNFAAGARCRDWVPAVNEVVNDVVIFARIIPIDGVGSTLARAGPCIVNGGTNLPAVGIMEFDVADVDALLSSGNFLNVVIHEMGHVLGIGTFWTQTGLLTGAGGADPFFTGVVARSQFAQLNTVTFSGNPVPVENVGGAGTRDAHWRESIFGRELMTGFIAFNVANPLSRLTVGSLQDLGYTVNLNGADPYSVTAALRNSFDLGTEKSINLGNDIADVPLYRAMPDGSTVLIRPGRMR